MDVKKDEQMQNENSGISRRKFLKILGQTSVVGAVGCGKSSAQKILPYVKAEANQVKGVSVWYSTTCGECDAGCGIQVRTRDGRAVKIEGNPDSPVNRGGVCAIGHSALQNMYDPDRVREPLAVKAGRVGDFQAVTWDEGISKLVSSLKPKSGKVAYVGHPKSGAMSELIKSFCDQFGVMYVPYNPVSHAAEARASELVFGTFGVPTYDFEKASVILNFGTDFLETWVSPCEFARGWADSRRKSSPCRVIHVEPRLSLTGANADTWLMANPGTEVKIALAVLKLLLEKGRGADVNADVAARLSKLVSGITLDKVASETGISRDKILSTAQYLHEAKGSLVLAGGASASTSDPLPLMVAANFINLILGNIGNTINLAAVRKPAESDMKAMQNLIALMMKGGVSTLIVDNTNPLFNLPPSFGFEYGLKKVATIISLSPQIDETSYQAQLILPMSTNLESWGDSEVRSGVYGLSQPVMNPVFNTKSHGDILIEVALKAGKTAVAAGQENFLGVLKQRWQSIHAQVGGLKSFHDFWLESVERGGYFAKVAPSSSAASPSEEAFKIKFESSVFGDAKSDASENLVLLPYPSVRSFDGRSANRPWLLEIPDPMSQISWDAWVEMHPDTAKSRGIAKGDVVTVRNFYGEINLGVVITPYIHPGVVACPIGHGHDRYGRFAEGNGANVMELLPAIAAKGVGARALFTAKVSAQRGRGKIELANVQGSDSQMGRELARTTYLGATAAAAHAAHGHEGHGEAHGNHGGHHEPKQMYVQREHPVYKWGMAVDLAACTGCSACVVACYSENNIPVVGRSLVEKGREMSWLRIERYFDTSGNDHGAEELHVSFLPMMCQHCGSAPCEPVCPAYATYHNEEGLNVMVYNRCVGTRYCSNNCSYKVRRFNWGEVDFPEPLNWQLNPDVTPRSVGVMEKCTFCIQRINDAKDTGKDLGRLVEDGEVKPACVQSCPTQALAFGNLNDPKSKVSKLSHSHRAYKVLDHHLNTQPAISYLEDVKYKEV